VVGGAHRFTLVEYARPVALVEEISEASSRSREEVRRLLIDRGARAARTLGFNENPITAEGATTRAVKIAGLLRLSPSIELEIAPKFLGDADGGRGWREDFFFLTVLSRHGYLLASEKLRASSGAPDDLSVLVARAMTSMYWDHYRRPLRTYERMRERGFFLDGEVDPFDLSFPEASGYDQEVLRLTRANKHNGLIKAAAQALIPEVGDPKISAGLVRMGAHLGEQQRPGRGRTRSHLLPGRSRRWQPLVDVSQDVLQGLGLAFEAGAATAPGFLVSTWQVWQDLLTIAARLGFGHRNVKAEVPRQLGQRVKVASGKLSELRVFPDMAVDVPGRRPFLLDAKYKGHVDHGRLAASEADIYEALAFARASNRTMVVLAYPALATEPLGGLGEATEVERVRVGDITIIAVAVEVRGISQRSGLALFSTSLARTLSSFVER